MPVYPGASRRPLTRRNGQVSAFVSWLVFPPAGCRLGPTRTFAASANPLAHGHRRPDTLGDLTGSFRPQLKRSDSQRGRVARTALKEVSMLTKSPDELLRSRDRLAGGRSRQMRRIVRARSVAVPRVHRCGDTDALDWRSDPHLLVILARCAEREREAREKGQFAWRGGELDERTRRAGAQVDAGDVRRD